MPEDRVLYERVKTMVCSQLAIASYLQILLSSMIYRKLQHPSEKTDEIVKFVTERMVPELYKRDKGKYCLKISVKKEIEALEEALHNETTLPDDLKNGKIVSNTVKYYTSKIKSQN